MTGSKKFTPSRLPRVILIKNKNEQKKLRTSKKKKKKKKNHAEQC